ncbi:MAG: hypothetical protein FWD23_09805 [Oscillospiraceae bacterium]|nr:hypothetical protein [Oscillospiraceae bacterium]
MDTKEKSNSEINLNVKIPPEQADGGFSMRDVVLTVYGAKKIFFAWCCIGLILGLAAAGFYYMTQKDADVPGDVSVTLTLNYYGAESNLYPNGAKWFSMRSFTNTAIFESALEKLELGVTVGDVINEVEITQAEGKYNIFTFTIPYGGNVFANNADKKDFLQALCGEYKKHITDRYYSKGTVGKLYEQHLSEFEQQIQDAALWEPDPFSFENNFKTIGDFYAELESILIRLYSEEPNYESPEGLNFEDYSKQMYDIRSKDVEEWSSKLQYNIYIRNIDKFKQESQYGIDALERERQYNLELAASYNELLASFQQKDSQGAIVPEAVGVLKEAQHCILTAAELQKQINKMKSDVEMLEANEPSILSNSREAETALLAAAAGLKKNQENVYGVIYDHYERLNSREAENSVLYSNPAVVTSDGQPASSGASMMRLALIVAGLTFVGFAVGFFATFVKKYLPDKKLK